MMIKSGYQEGLYYRQGFPAPTEALEEQLRALLRENHGVGILGGSYENGFPLCMVSELALQMLGYSTFAEMEEATGNCMAGLICSSDYSEEGFAALTGECELFLRGKEENRWVRLVKRDAVFPGVDKKLWIASVCDMDALYQKELQVNQMTMEKRRQDLAQQAKLAQANRRLEHQTIALEHALAEARLNNEVISAIGKVYWLIYRLDLEAGTFQQVSVSDTSHCILGDHGITAERFPESCKNTVMPAYQPVMQAFLDPSTLPDRLAEREEISQEYETITGNWHVGRFIVQKRNEYGRVTRALYAIQIINEQKKQELEYEKRLAGIAEEAQRASLSKTDFLRRMSHDIRTPINGIRGMIEIANHCADDLQKQQECRQKVWEASGYLLSLVNSVLDMNKLESGAVVLAHTPFDMMQLLKEADSVSSMQAAEHSVHYIVDETQSRIVHRYLIGSPSHIKQVLMNLTSNAIKYNRENGSVTVSCRELSSDDTTAEFLFTCADTGIGMSEEFQKHAFEAFSQEGRHDVHTHYEGSGLGLSIVKALVEQMDGRMEFSSKEGVGTTFRIWLPITIDQMPLSALSDQAEAPIDLHGVRVLVAEDNDLNMEIARFFIEQNGGTVIPAANGREAIQKFAASAPGEINIILMDVMMPVMNGYDATQFIRGMERPDAAEVPILAMSANAFQDDVLKSRAAGMNDHLAKPLSTEKLLSAIQRYVARNQ